MFDRQKHNYEIHYIRYREVSDSEVELFDIYCNNKKKEILFEWWESKHMPILWEHLGENKTGYTKGNRKYNNWFE